MASMCLSSTNFLFIVHNIHTTIGYNTGTWQLHASYLWLHHVLRALYFSSCVCSVEYCIPLVSSEMPQPSMTIRHTFLFTAAAMVYTSWATWGVRVQGSSSQLASYHGGT